MADAQSRIARKQLNLILHLNQVRCHLNQTRQVDIALHLKVCIVEPGLRNRRHYGRPRHFGIRSQSPNIALQDGVLSYQSILMELNVAAQLDLLETSPPFANQIWSDDPQRIDLGRLYLGLDIVVATHFYVSLNRSQSEQSLDGNFRQSSLDQTKPLQWQAVGRNVHPHRDQTV